MGGGGEGSTVSGFSDDAGGGPSVGRGGEGSEGESLLGPGVGLGWSMAGELMEGDSRGRDSSLNTDTSRLDSPGRLKNGDRRDWGGGLEGAGSWAMVNENGYGWRKGTLEGLAVVCSCGSWAAGWEGEFAPKVAVVARDECTVCGEGCSGCMGLDRWLVRLIRLSLERE